MATNTILGIFDDPHAARRAVERLREGTLKLDDVSIISRATETGAPVASADDVSAGEGAAVGAVWGGLIGLASLLIPGVGPFIALGALGAALTGAVTGAVVGGIAAALIDFGDISPEEAHKYEQQIHSGMTLVAVKAPDATAQQVRRILADAGAESIRDNQTGITSEADVPVRVAGDRSGLDEEFGPPADPTTIDRRGVYDLPRIDRAADMTGPRVEPDPTIDDPVATGRAGQIGPRRSGTYADDDQSTAALRPETLGVPPSAGGAGAGRATHAERAVGDSEPTADLELGTGRAGQVQPRESDAADTTDDTLTTPDAPAGPHTTGRDTNLPDLEDDKRTM